jgi:hypothetical protein
MTDQSPTMSADTNSSSINPAAAIEKAKLVADRYKRQVGYLMGLTGRLPMIQASLKQRIKDAEAAAADVIRLTAEEKQTREHIEKLNIWVANNQDMPCDVAEANSLAAKIQKLQKEIEKKQKELHRMEVGLPT